MVKLTRRGFFGLLAAAVPFASVFRIFSRPTGPNVGAESIQALIQAKIDAAEAEFTRYLRGVMYGSPRGRSVDLYIFDDPVRHDWAKAGFLGRVEGHLK